MNIDDEKTIKLEEFKVNKKKFEESIKFLEKNIAESITNKVKIKELKKDLREAFSKFSEAEKCLDDLRIQLNNNSQTSDIKD